MKRRTNLDMLKTGQMIKKAVQDSDYTVKELQNELGFECPQAIYRWFKGDILPSIDSLYILSKLLNVPMEDLLVERGSDKSEKG